MCKESCCSHFLTVPTAWVVGLQVKTEVTSKDIMVSSGDSFKFLQFVIEVLDVMRTVFHKWS